MIAKLIEPLISALKNQNHLVRSDAAKALGQLGAQIALKPLISALEDTKGIVRSNAATALAQFGQSAVDPLLTVVQNKNKVS